LSSKLTLLYVLQLTYLEEFEDLVLAEVIVGLAKDFVVDVLQSKWVHYFLFLITN